MRRLSLVFSAVVASVLMIISAGAISAAAQTEDDPNIRKDVAGSESSPPDSSPLSGTVSDAVASSQGSIGGEAPSVAASEAWAADLAEEQNLPDYSQVVGNSSRDRFAAPGWERATGSTAHGGDYVHGSEGDGPARFEVEVPTDSDYTVYAWWPAAAGNTDSARFGIAGASGLRWETVDQTTDGGLWVNIGTYEMEAGERVIQVAGTRGEAGRVVADAVAIVRGQFVAPPEEATDGDAAMRASDGGVSTMKRGKATRRDIVRRARSFIGTRYKWGTCTNRRMSCTCLTKKAHAPWRKLPMSERGQWLRGKRVQDRRPGDILFFKERGRSGPITHVGIFSGNGNIIHASAYWKHRRVVESKVKYINGYMGARRIGLR